MEGGSLKRPLLEWEGGAQNGSTQYLVLGTQREDETPNASRAIDVRPQAPEARDEEERLARENAQRRRAQRRAWRRMMDEAGYQLPFPEDAEAIREILAHTLGRVVGRKMRPQHAEAVVHVCKLMLRS